jgi:allophanate hydrolase subunit 1
MEEKFSKETEIINNNQVEIIEMKTSLNQIQITMDSVISRQDQVERMSEMKDKTKELLHVNKHKEKLIHMNTTYKNSQTQSNLRIHKELKYKLKP